MATLSTMESQENARELLREADRAEAAPWIDYPPTPAWYPVSVGLWGAAMVLALGALPPVWGAVVAVLLVGVEGAFLGWYRRYRGTMPAGPLPTELRPAVVRLVVGLLLLVVGAGALVLAGQPWVAAAAVLVLGTALVWWYERAYAEAAVATRARLG
jgi:hypothetical protein